MKSVNLALIFLLIIIPFIMIADHRINLLSMLNNLKVEYDNCLESAIDDAINSLVEVDSNKQIILYKENAIEEFYHSLYLNFGVLGNRVLENKLRKFIPIILIADNDGAYIYHSFIEEQDGEKILVHKFSDKIYYEYEDLYYIYHFSLDNHITVFNKSRYKISEGLFSDVIGNLNKSELNDENFIDIKQNTIIHIIEEHMDYYIRNYNQVAKDFGIEYTFWLPVMDHSDWYRTIADRGLMVIMQGYPYDLLNFRYNKIGIAGSRIKKNQIYFLSIIEGREYYHRQDCKWNMDSKTVFYSKEEAAFSGAYPCYECKP